MEDNRIKHEEYLTAKERRIVEQNPKVEISQLRKLNSKAEKTMKKRYSMDFTTANSTFYNRVNFNQSNIFNDDVKIYYFIYLLILLGKGKSNIRISKDQSRKN